MFTAKHPSRLGELFGRLLLVGLGLLLVLVVGLVASLLVWRGGINRDIRMLEQKVRDAGEPLTLEELAASLPPVPDKENIALALMDLWEEEDPEFWRAFRAGERELPRQAERQFDPDLPILGRGGPRGSGLLPWTEEQLRAARAFVETNQVRAARVQAALARPQARFPVEVADGFLGELPHLDRLRQETSCLLLEGLLAAHDEQPAKAVVHFEQMIQLGETVRGEPYSISQLVRIACFERALNGMESLLVYTRPDEALLDRLGKLLAGIKLDDSFHQSLLGERVVGLAVFTRPLAEIHSDSAGEGGDFLERQIDKSSLSSLPINFIGFFSLDHRLMLRTYDRVSELTRQGLWDGHLEAAAVISEAAVEADKFPPKIFTGMLMPVLRSVMHRFVSIESRRRCALAAIAVERFRREQAGALPASLEELPAFTPEGLWLDPFDGQPLRYRITADGYLIYSVGPDRIDQQGLRTAPAGQPNARDVVFAVERPVEP
jgi:hypothetical protein